MWGLNRQVIELFFLVLPESHAGWHPALSLFWLLSRVLLCRWYRRRWIGDKIGGFCLVSANESVSTRLVWRLMWKNRHIRDFYIGMRILRRCFSNNEVHRCFVLLDWSNVAKRLWQSLSRRRVDTVVSQGSQGHNVLVRCLFVFIFNVLHDNIAGHTWRRSGLVFSWNVFF